MNHHKKAFKQIPSTSTLLEMDNSLIQHFTHCLFLLHKTYNCLTFVSTVPIFVYFVKSDAFVHWPTLIVSWLLLLCVFDNKMSDELFFVL